MAAYRRRNNKKYSIAKFFMNLVFVFVLISVVLISGKYVIETTYAVLTSIDGIEDINKTDNLLILVNKQHDISRDYIPGNLEEVDIRFSPGTASKQKLMQEDAAKALEKLFEEAENEGIILYGVSGYRSYEYQKQIYDRKVKAVGKKEAGKYVAYPGQSEHQTGLAMDVTNKAGVSKSLTASFGETKEGQWLIDNAHDFGFIIRYPEGKEDITGYNYEPWHLRYVGNEASVEIKTLEIVLEEYLEDKTTVN